MSRATACARRASRGAVLAAWAGALALMLPAAAALAAAPGARAQDVDPPRVDVELSPRTGEVGLVMAVNVTVQGAQAADCHLLEVPEMLGARLDLVEGPVHSQKTLIDNGRVSREVSATWHLRLVPQQDGVLTVPPFRLNCRGMTYASEPLALPVRGNTVPDDVVRLDVHWPESELWQGQVFDVTVEAMVAEEYADRIVSGGLQLTLAWYDGLSGLVRLDDPPAAGRVGHLYLNGARTPVPTELERRTVGERRYLTYTLPVRMLASRPGRIEVPGSFFSARVATEVSQRRDPFDFFRGTQTVATRMAEPKTSTPALALEVQAPPAQGRPPGYTNAVGHFELSGAAAPRRLAVGETCTVSLKLVGTGNLEFVEWPEFTALAADFRMFGKEERREPGLRVLALEISPKHEHVEAVPPLELAAFDPSTGRYEQHAVGPFPLDVEPGGEGGLTVLAAPEEILNDLETIRETLPAPAGAPWPWWLWLAPGALLLALVELRARVLGWRREHPAEVARRGARARLDAALGAAEGTRDVAVAFGKFLSDRLGGPPAGLTVDEALERLPRRRGRGLDDESMAHLEAELRKLVSGWEASYLGGRPLDLDVAWSEARYLADLVEDVT